METSRKLWYLRRCNLFAKLTPSDMKRLEAISRMQGVPKDTTMFFPDDVSESVFLLKEGRIKLYRLSEDGKEITLDMIEPGELFGELALIGEASRDTFAQALVDSLVCVFPSERFVTFLQSRPDLALGITKLVGWRRKRLEARLEELVCRSVPCRLAGVLARAAEQGALNGKVSERVCLTHEELARLVGCSREMVTQALKALAEKRLIKTGYRHVLVLNREGLVSVR